MYLGYSGTPVPNTTTVNGHALSSNVTVTASDTGLGNVLNFAQVKETDFTAKGDILVGSGAAADSALNVGSDNYILTADHTQALGMHWAAAPATAPNVVGSVGSPTLITAVGGIAFSGTAWTNYNFISGNGGTVVVSANPQIAAGTSIGQTLILINESGNPVELQDGNGISLNGTWIGSSLTLVFDGSVWFETARR